MLLHDFIFIDYLRLKTYYEQISSSQLLKTQKIPTWSFSLSTTGPEVSTELSPATREATDTEKIKAVHNYLLRENLLKNTGANFTLPEYSEQTFFVITQLKARRVLIPLKKSPFLSGKDSLTMWIGEDEFPGRQNHLLYLIEASSDSDKHHNFHRMSDYTIFEFILYDIEQKSAELRQKLLGRTTLPNKHLKIPIGLNKSSQWEEWKKNDEDYDSLRQLFSKFSVSPFEYFEKMNAQVSSPKIINSLYRIREILDVPLWDGGDSIDHKTGIVGYPLYVSERIGFETSQVKLNQFSKTKDDVFAVTLNDTDEHSIPPTCCNCNKELTYPRPISIAPLCKSCQDIVIRLNQKGLSLRISILLVFWIVMILNVLSNKNLGTTLLIALFYTALLLPSTYTQLKSYVLASPADKLLYQRITNAVRTKKNLGNRTTFLFLNETFASKFQKANLSWLTNLYGKDT